MTTDERAMGVFIMPLLVALQAIPVIRPGVEDRAAVLQGPLFGVHVSSLLFAYASFGLACVIGITYVLLFKEIKAKHLGFFYARLPSLQILDRMNQVAVVVGWIFLTIGIVSGAVWAAQAQGGYAPGSLDPRVQAMSLEDPKIFVALVCWIVYSFELFAARRIGSGLRSCC
jgi:ABC-type transport system involved in cytochrome c biogenesis permease subunit